MLRRVLTVLALAVIPVATTAAAPAGPTATVTGHVVSSSGAPVAGVALQVWSYHEDGTGSYHDVTTDAAGAYSVSGLKPEQYYAATVSPRWRSREVVSVLARGGTTTVEPEVVALRAAIVHGTVISSTTGEVLRGVSVTTPLPNGSVDGSYTVKTAADGSFTATAFPGKVTVAAYPSGYFPAERVLDLAEGAEGRADLVVDPSARIDYRIRSRAGGEVDQEFVTVDVDGCRVQRTAVPPCDHVQASGTSLIVSPGRHVLRLEVRNPVTPVVRRAVRTVDARQGAPVAVDPMVVRADPQERAVVRAGTYRKGRAVVVRVEAPLAIDWVTPHLRPTFLVDGRTVQPVRVRWVVPPDRGQVLVATLPARLSSARSLRVAVTLHGNADYVGQTSATVRLSRSR